MKLNILAVLVLTFISMRARAADKQCESGGTAGVIPDMPNYYTITGTSCSSMVGSEKFECPDGSCLNITNICDSGVNDDCNGNGNGTSPADEQSCGAPSCSGCPEDMTVGQGTIVTWVPPQVLNSSFALVGDEAHLPYTTFPDGPSNVTYYVFGPVPYHYCRFTVTVTGTADPPVNNCPEAFPKGEANVNAQTATVTWTEITSSANNTVTINDEDYRPGNEFPIGYTRVVYTITEPQDGNQSFCIFYVSVTSNPSSVGGSCTLNPITKTLVPPAQTATVTEELEAQLAQISGTGNEIVSKTTSHATDYLFPLGTTQFVVNTVDSDGNSYTCQAPITIERPSDDILPVISNCPTSGVTVCYKTGDEVAKGTWNKPTASDNIMLKEFSSNINPDNFLQVPTSQATTANVIYTATDWNDNVATCEFTLTFEADILPPVISNCNNYTEYTTMANGSMIEVNYPKPTVSDNCDQYQSVEPVGKMFLVPSVQRITYTATDIGNASVECSFTVEVKIDVNPQFNDCPLSQTETAAPGTTSAEVKWSAPTVVDDNQLDADNVELSITPGLPGVVLNAEDDQELTLERGVYTVEYSYSDVNLQKGICTFTVTVQDKEAPTFENCPPAMERTLNAVDETIAVEWDKPTAKDNDGEEVTVEIQNDQYASGSRFSAGQYTIIYKGTDQSGNEGFCNFLLTVNAYDTSNFWIDCPGNFGVETDPGLPSAVVEWDPPELRAGLDNPRFSQTRSPGSSFVIGVTTVEYTVFDSAENSEVCSFTITVNDKEPPVIIGCPGDITVYGLTGRSTVPVFWTEPRTSDNSGSTVSVSAIPAGPGAQFVFGTSQVYYSAADPSGNSMRGCYFQVTALQPGDTSVISGSAQFLTIRGASSTNAVSQASNLEDDLDVLFRQNTAISNILAGVQVGTPSPLSDGNLLVPFTLYFGQCRAAFTHVRDSLTQNLEGNNRDTFDINNVVISSTLQLDTKEFMVAQLIIDQDLERPVGDQDLNYNGDYSNRQTTAYRNFEDRVCGTMDNVFSAFTGYCGCALWRLYPGSIGTDLIIIFDDDSSVSQSALHDQIGSGITGNNLNNLIIDNFDQTTTVTEVCPETYCRNGGKCEPNAFTYLSQCSCPTDYSGNQCQTYSGPGNPNPTESPGGTDPVLTTEEIIGIVVGAVGGLLLLIILLSCFCVFCLRPSEPKPRPIIQEPLEPFYAVQPPRRNVVVRDVLEPPPIPRPYPVRVPERIPVPMVARVPVPVPQPVLRPFPVPIRQPVPFPVRVPVPVPQAVPRPVPLAIRQPVAVANPIAVPRPVPVPIRTAIPFAQNIPVPVREQVPVMQPFGVPVASRQPFGPGLGSGFGSRLGPNLGGFNGGLGLNAGLGLNSGFGLNGGLGTGFNGGLNGFNSTRF